MLKALGLPNQPGQLLQEGTAMILTCRCRHEFQDKLYGKYKRVHNSMAKTPGAYRCTVCGAETAGRREIKAKTEVEADKKKGGVKAKDRRENKKKKK